MTAEEELAGIVARMQAAAAAAAVDDAAAVKRCAVKAKWIIKNSDGQMLNSATKTEPHLHWSRVEAMLVDGDDLMRVLAFITGCEPAREPLLDTIILERAL